ncbi:MAG: hypothetical protein U0869_07945 [Chloroflexota bacterium]
MKRLVLALPVAAMVLLSGPAMATGTEVHSATIDGHGITGTVTIRTDSRFTSGTLSADLEGLTDSASWVQVSPGQCGEKYPWFVVKRWINHPVFTDGHWTFTVDLPVVSAPALKTAMDHYDGAHALVHNDGATTCADFPST